MRSHAFSGGNPSGMTLLEVMVSGIILATTLLWIAQTLALGLQSYEQGLRQEWIASQQESWTDDLRQKSFSHTDLTVGIHSKNLVFHKKPFELLWTVSDGSPMLKKVTFELKELPSAVSVYQWNWVLLKDGDSL